MPNIIGGRVNFFYYAGLQPGRLSGTLLAGETDLRSQPIAQSANVTGVYGASPASGFQSFTPGSGFNSLNVLQVGQGYFVDAKASFDVAASLPKLDPSDQAAALVQLRQIQGTPTPTPTPAPSPGSTGFRIGTNMTSLFDYEPSIALVDAFRTAREWIPGAPGQFSTGAIVPMDADGQLTHIPSGASHVLALMFWDLQFQYPPGQYLLLYTGTADVQVGGAASKNTAASVTGREVFNVTGNGGITLEIRRTNSNINSQEAVSIRNIRFIPASAESTYQTQPFFQPWLDKISNFHTLRFMDWMGTNNSGQVQWANRPKLTDARWRFASVELAVDLCNALNKDPWFCIPHLADDDYITQFATIVRDRLNSNLNPIVEFSNEVWNFQFAQAQDAIAKSAALWGANVGNGWVQYLGMKTVQVRRIWRSVWGAQANRIKAVLSAQAGYLGIEDGMLNAPNWISSGQGVSNPVAPKTEIDLYAIAPYFDAGMNGRDAAGTALIASWADEGQAGIDKAIGQLRNASQFQVDSSIEGAKVWINYHKNIANSINKPLVLYECGQHLTEPYNGTQGDRDKCVEFFKTVNRSPGMGQLYTEYFTYLRDVGVKLAMNFTEMTTYSRFGYWGIWENSLQTTSAVPKANAVVNAIATLSGTGNA